MILFGKGTKEVPLAGASLTEPFKTSKFCTIMRILNPRSAVNS